MTYWNTVDVLGLSNSGKLVLFENKKNRPDKKGFPLSQVSCFGRFNEPDTFGVGLVTLNLPGVAVRPISR